MVKLLGCIGLMSVLCCANCYAEKSDLFLDNVIIIGKQLKKVTLGGTIVLTPADALNTGPHPAFDVYYTYKNKGAAVTNYFVNKIFFNGAIVAINSGLTAKAGDSVKIQTQPYMGTNEGIMEIDLDVNNDVKEVNENNNTGKIKIKFKGF